MCADLANIEWTSLCIIRSWYDLGMTRVKIDLHLCRYTQTTMVVQCACRDIKSVTEHFVCTHFLL